MTASWKRIPPALRLGIAGYIGYLIGDLVYVLASSDLQGLIGGRWFLAGYGVSVAYALLVLCGLLELARGARRVVIGARLAAAATALSLALVVFEGLVVMHESWLSPSLFTAMNDVQAALSLASIVGLVIAARVGIPATIAAIAAAALIHPPSFVATRLDRWLGLDMYAGYTLQTVLLELRLVITLLLVVKICRDRDDLPDPRRAIAGLRWVARSFWLRLLAAIAFPAFMLLLALGQPRDPGSSIQLVVIAAAIVGVLAMVMFAIGSVMAAQVVFELRGALLAGGALAAWCAGVMLQQLQQVHDALHGHDRGGGDQFSLALPVIGIAAAVCSGIAVHRMFIRRGLAQDASRTVARISMFVAFSLVMLAVQSWLLPTARSESGAMLMLVILVGSGLIVNIGMGRLFASASVAVEHGEESAELPTARVISAP